MLFLQHVGLENSSAYSPSTLRLTVQSYAIAMLLYILAILSISGQRVLSQSSVPPFVCDSPSTSQPDARLNDTIVATVDESKFATTSEVKQIVHQICKGESGLGGLRLPGSKANYDVYNFVKCQLEEMPGLQIMTGDFEIGSWQPEGGSMYNAARLRVGDTDVQVASAMSYSLPTNGEFVSGESGSANYILTRVMIYANFEGYRSTLVRARYRQPV